MNSEFPNHVQDVNIQERNQDPIQKGNDLKVQDQDQDILAKKKEKAMHHDDKNDKVK